MAQHKTQYILQVTHNKLESTQYSAYLYHTTMKLAHSH